MVTYLAWRTRDADTTYSDYLFAVGLDITQVAFAVLLLDWVTR